MSYILYKTWVARQSSGPAQTGPEAVRPASRAAANARGGGRIPAGTLFFTKKVLQAYGGRHAAGVQPSRAGNSAMAKSRNRRRASGVPRRAGMTA